VAEKTMVYGRYNELITIVNGDYFMVFLNMGISGS
jgi:hypothetical protein